MQKYRKIELLLGSTLVSLSTHSKTHIPSYVSEADPTPGKLDFLASSMARPLVLVMQSCVFHFFLAHHRARLDDSTLREKMPFFLHLFSYPTLHVVSSFFTLQSASSPPYFSPGSQQGGNLTTIILLLSLLCLIL